MAFLKAARKDCAAVPRAVSTMKDSMWKDRGRDLKLYSHIWVVRAHAALRRHPVDVAVGVLDVAGFAVDAVLRVDDVARLPALLHPLVDAGRAIARRWTGVDVMVG